jgi:predicted porin
MAFAPANDGTTGKEYHIKVGGRYDFGGNLHLFGDYNYYKAKRDYTLAAYDNQYHFIHLGVTYDITDKFSAQGNFAYVKQKTNLAGITAVDNSTVIPGMGLKYEFNENTTLALDYKFFKFSDNTTTGASGVNDWKANRIMTRLNVKF